MTKPTKWLCAQQRLRSARASTQSDQSSLSAWRKLGSLATHWADSDDSDQIGQMPRATTWQNQQNDLCAQRRLRSAWASAQSDQSSLCAQWVPKDLMFLHADNEDSDQTGRGPGWSETSLGTCHFVGFVLLRLRLLCFIFLCTAYLKIQSVSMY